MREKAHHGSAMRRRKNRSHNTRERNSQGGEGGWSEWKGVRKEEGGGEDMGGEE